MTEVIDRLRDGLTRKAADMRALAQEHGEGPQYELVELTLRLMAEVCEEIAAEEAA